MLKYSYKIKNKKKITKFPRRSNLAFYGLRFSMNTLLPPYLITPVRYVVNIFRKEYKPTKI